jgi:MerR family transcriptional regulator, light-induced transcriptional regulator
MAAYAIKDLERLTGIKAHTIRIWEKRYQLLKPNRSDSNIRIYDDDDLKKILNLAILNRNGIKISHLASMTEKEIAERITSIYEKNNDTESIIDSMLMCMMDFDEKRFEKIFSNTLIKYDFGNMVIRVIYPLLEKIGILWQTGTINPAHEHFISHLIRQKFIVAIDNEVPDYQHPDPVFILFLPEGEWHEFSLLFYYYLLRKNKYKVIYLGQSVPFEDLKNVSLNWNNFALFTSLISAMDEKGFDEFCSRLSKEFQGHSIYISGKRALENKNKMPAEIIPVESAEKFLEILSGQRN